VGLLKIWDAWNYWGHYPARREHAPEVSGESHAVELRVLPGEDDLMTDPLVPSHLFTAIDHVGVAVPDLDEAIASYRDNFGMQLVHEEVNEEQGVREAMIAVGDPSDADGQRIQLLAPLNEESTIAKFLSRSGPGLQQLAYRVTDVDQVCSTLRERGLRLLYDEPRRGTAGSRINFIHPKDAGGVLVELVEPAEH
jgi:methylmalonyl-CoA/ethylmalonyl-CoA epimerase